MLDALPLRDRVLLRVQRLVAHVCFPVLASVMIYRTVVVWRLSLRDLRALRRRFRELVPERRPPTLICANHLTRVDSIVLAWAVASPWTYLRDFSILAWNLPEKANFAGKLSWQLAGFLGKCVYVSRGGAREEVRRALAKVVYLLRRGELVSIFPEGTRSLTGRVDVENFGYGVGQVLQAVPEAAVLCVYMRGRAQREASDWPHRGDEYSVELELIRPTTTEPRLRGARDLATQVVQKLAEMERRHLRAG